MNKSAAIRIRLSEEEKAILESKAKSANMNPSSFVRHLIQNSQVNPLTNGKELAQKLGLFHQDMINLHQDALDKFQTLQSVVEENNQLLTENTSLLNNPMILETLQMQNLRISAIANASMTHYEAEERRNEEKIKNLIPIVTVEKR